MPTRTQYIPIEQASEGMALGDAVKDTYQLTVLPAGSVLTNENIQQLQAHAVEFICVSTNDERSGEDIATQSAEAAQRLSDIFAGADLTQPCLAALFKQLLQYRSA